MTLELDGDEIIHWLPPVDAPVSLVGLRSKNSDEDYIQVSRGVSSSPGLPISDIHIDFTTKSDRLYYRSGSAIMGACSLSRRSCTFAIHAPRAALQKFDRIRIRLEVDADAFERLKHRITQVFQNHPELLKVL